MWNFWVLFHNLLKFITKMSDAFSVEQFRDVFQATPKVKNKLQPFIAQYKALNMDWIINSFEELHRYFFDQKTDITLKFNSIFGIKFLFDTTEVVLVNLIEIYFLPTIFEIASFDARGNQEKRGTAYFVSVGYPKDTPEIQKLSYNFVRLASEFVQVAATVKSKRLYMNEEIDDPSEYFEAYQRLIQQGWKPYAKPAYYKDAAAMPAAFKKNLQGLDQVADPFIDFYVEFFRLYLEKGKVYQGKLNPKRALESGDVYITGPVIDQCVQFFKSDSVRQRLQAVSLLNEFIRWGDIEAAYQINCTDLIDDTLREFSNTNSGISNLSRGKSMFAKLESSEQLKQELYVQVLKAIQFWSLCFPRALKVKNRDSKVKCAHDELRMKLKIEFPEDKNLKEHKMEFDRNFLRKRKRNNIILDELQNEDPEYVSILNTKPKIQSSSSIPAQSKTKIEAPPPPPAETAPGDYGRIKNSIKQAKSSLSTLFQNQTALPQKIARLNKFKQEFQNNVESADVTDDEFNQLLEEGSPVLDRIDKVMSHLNNYTAKKISFKDLPEAINSQGKSRLKESQIESPVKKEVAQPASSNVKIEPPKSQKKINHEETSLKAEEKSIKQEKTIPKIEKQRQQTEKKVAKTMQQVERVSKDSVKVAETKSLKAAQEIKAKAQQSKLNLEKQKQQKKIEAQTPIKQLRQKFQEERYMSSLPQISKQSLSKSLDEQLNIEPASHQILAEKEVINLNLFKDTSLNQKQQQLGAFSRKHPSRAFEDEIEHDVEVNPPKVINNVKGSYRLSGQAPPQQVADVVKDSRSRIDFEQSKFSKVEVPEDDEDDLIAMPEINPLDVSYHDIGGFEDQLKENKELSFKKCFEAEKYLLGSNKKTKMFWLEKDTMSLIKPGGVRRNSRNKDSTISIPEILSEKDKKYQSEIKYIQEQNNRKIKELEKKINNLQSEGKQLQIKIVEQDKQIKSYKAESSVSNSRAKKNLYIQDQDQLFRTRHAQKSTKERSFYEEPRIKESKCLQPQGKLISSRKYAQYFNTFSQQKKKKNLLKNKELLFKDETIQFGCMSKREGDTLFVTFYITPEGDLEGLTYNISPVANSNLLIALQPRNIATIRQKKQEKVIVSVKVLEVPYSLPDIQFLYNLDGKMSSHRFTVPCAFHKFIHVEGVSEKDLTSRFQSSRNIIRGEQVPYSRKLLKNMESLCEYFPSGSLLRGGESNQNGEVQFGGKGAWQRESFWLKILIKPSQFLCVQAVGEDLSHSVQFYVSLVTSLLMKNVELSELK